MAVPEVHVKMQWRQINEINKALGTMRRFGILESSPAYRALNKARGALFGKIGFRVPRPTNLLLKLLGLSPGEIKVWHDSEAGWMVEARKTPKAPPVYHYVDDEVAMSILIGKLDKKLEDWLMVPDPYVGE